MGFSLGELLRVALLLLNAMAILSERRFLAPFGLASHDVQQQQQQQQGSATGGPNGFYRDDPFGGGFNNTTTNNNSNGGAGNRTAVKTQIAQLLSSVRTLLRWPLIIINTVAIAFALVLG